MMPHDRAWRDGSVSPYDPTTTPDPTTVPGFDGNGPSAECPRLRSTRTRRRDCHRPRSRHRRCLRARPSPARRRRPAPRRRRAQARLLRHPRRPTRRPVRHPLRRPPLLLETDPRVDPIVTVLHVGPVERIIGSYGVMLALSALVGGALAARAAARARMDVGATIAAIGLVAAGAAAGGYAMFVLVEWARLGSPLSAFRSPGLVFWGAPVGGGLACLATAKRLGLRPGRLVDVALPALPAAHSLGRIGCFLGGCCYGAPWNGPWAVVYTTRWRRPRIHRSAPPRAALRVARSPRPRVRLRALAARVRRERPAPPPLLRRYAVLRLVSRLPR